MKCVCLVWIIFVSKSLTIMNSEFDKVSYIFDILFEAVIIIDKSHKIKYSNISAQRLFGYEKSELLNSPLDILIPKRFQNTHLKKVRDYMKHGKPTLMGDRPLLHAVTKSGEEIPISISICSTVFDGEKYSISIIRDASMLHTKISNITALIETDYLTKLSNRLAFSNRMQKQISESQKFSIFFIDLTDFKQFNDRYGHNIGDRVLEITGSRLRQSIRDHDLAARIGGDEFVLLINDLTEKSSLILKAKKIAKAIRSPMTIDGVEFQVKANIGFASYPQDGSTEEELLRISDQAMYHAKKHNADIYPIDDRSNYKSA